MSVRQDQLGRAGRPFYKKKRYVIPALLLALGLAGQSADDSTPKPETFAAASIAPPTQPAPADTQAAADRAAAEEAAADAAADRAAAEAAAQEAAADKKAAKVAAKKAAAELAAKEKAAAVKLAAAEQAAADRAAARAARRATAATPTPTAVYYENCDAVRAAGAAPIRRGQPGYAAHLDRDNDGQGCGAD